VIEEFAEFCAAMVERYAKHPRQQAIRQKTRVSVPARRHETAKSR
jgi:hypothetical protein